MLVIALPLKLTHKFHHTELNKRKYGNLFVSVGGDLQIPDQCVFVFTDKITCNNRHTVLLCLETGIPHTVCGGPLFGLGFAGLVCGAPEIVSVLDIGIETASVGGDMEEFVVVDAPDLRGLIESDTAACLRHHSVEGAVGEIVHPRRGGVVLFETNLTFLIVKLIHSGLHSAARGGKTQFNTV